MKYSTQTFSKCHQGFEYWKQRWPFLRDYLHVRQWVNPFMSVIPSNPPKISWLFEEVVTSASQVCCRDQMSQSRTTVFWQIKVSEQRRHLYGKLQSHVLWYTFTHDVNFLFENYWPIQDVRALSKLLLTKIRLQVVYCLFFFFLHRFIQWFWPSCCFQGNSGGAGQKIATDRFLQRPDAKTDFGIPFPPLW